MRELLPGLVRPDVGRAAQEAVVDVGARETGVDDLRARPGPEVRRLIPGDTVRVYGGVRPMNPGLTLNAEKMEVLGLTEKVSLRNPRCPECGGGTESMGADQGLRCKKCGYRDPSLQKIRVVEPRRLKTGTYLPDRDAHRHLTKPLERYGRERPYLGGLLSEPWISGTPSLSRR